MESIQNHRDLGVQPLSKLDVRSAPPSNRRPQIRLGEGAFLPFLQGGGRKLAHRFMEQLIEIQPCVEMQKSAAEADRRAIHENELARDQDWTPFPQGLVNNKGFLA